MFAAVSLELTVKNVILRPLVSGLVHNEVVAGFVAQSAVGRGGANRFTDLLFQLLNEVADLDLSTYQRDDQACRLRTEVETVIKLRNGILHEGETVTSDQATMAVDVSRALLCDVFPDLIKALDMTTDEGLVVGW